jgi:ferredoxin-type protein NapH
LIALPSLIMSRWRGLPLVIACGGRGTKNELTMPMLNELIEKLSCMRPTSPTAHRFRRRTSSLTPSGSSSSNLGNVSARAIWDEQMESLSVYRYKHEMQRKWKRGSKMERQKVRKLLLLVSFLLFPVTIFYLSPVLIITGGFSGIVAGCLLVFAALFVSSLVFGRAFCGWICPAGGLQECCCSQIVDNNVKSRKVDRIKYIIWAPWLMTTIITFIMAGGVKGVDLFYMTDHGISVSDLTGLIIYLFFVVLITVLALALGRRGMCHSICWMAPFMIIGTTIKDRLGYPSLHLDADPAKCVQCGLCSRNCPMGLEVTKMVQAGHLKNNECILCGECADHCNKKVIKLTFGNPKA